MAGDSEPPLAAHSARWHEICLFVGQEGGREIGCSALYKLSVRLNEGQASVLMCGVSHRGDQLNEVVTPLRHSVLCIEYL